ncbi:MAG TPA: HAD hydrolase-like protein [Kofleriaceae bacterium]|nr:HAD hydrolase-like protein [Kofleriaceae bacterium]
MAAPPPEPATIAELLDRYDGVLLDAYGVLVDDRGLLPGAAALLAELDRRGTPFAIVTNDASRLPATYAARFARHGVRLAAERVVTSGSLLPGYFRDHGLVGARTCVLGTPDAFAYVRAGGGVPVALERGMAIDAVAVCDDSGTPFVDGIELAFSAVVRAVEAGRRPALVLPNPDLIYPKGDAEYGFTAGAMALLIEAALGRRLPGHGLVFDRLGKPGPQLFAEARNRVGGHVVMIGDQLETDIAGACAAGIDAALLAGVSRWPPARPGDSTSVASGVAPRYLLATIEP